MAREAIVSPAAWVGPQIQNDDSWIMRLDEAEVAEVDAALSGLKAKGRSIPFGKEDFPLPNLAARIVDEIPDRLENGLGFVLVRGLSRDRYSDQDCELVYWGLASHLGRPISQNRRGHVLGHVRDEGKSLADPTVRPYQTKRRMDFHADLLPVEILGLFCCRTAKSGGESYIVSALTVHNIIAKERPDLLEVLYQPFNLDWRGEEPEGTQPWHTCPMFSVQDGKFTSCISGRVFFESVSRWGEHLALTDIQREALDFAQDVAERPELRLSMMFQEGDIQLLNNQTMLQARSEYEDHDEPDLKRHLLRMWISRPEGQRRSLSPALDDRRRIVEMGGIPIKEAA
jgi:hypothetical protein